MDKYTRQLYCLFIVFIWFFETESHCVVQTDWTTHCIPQDGLEFMVIFLPQFLRAGITVVQHYTHSDYTMRQLFLYRYAQPQIYRPWYASTFVKIMIGVPFGRT